MENDKIRKLKGETLSEQERLNLLEELCQELYEVHGGCTVNVHGSGAKVVDGNGNTVDEVEF